MSIKADVRHCHLCQDVYVRHVRSTIDDGMNDDITNNNVQRDHHQQNNVYDHHNE